MSREEGLFWMSLYRHHYPNYHQLFLHQSNAKAKTEKQVLTEEYIYCNNYSMCPNVHVCCAVEKELAGMILHFNNNYPT